MKVFVRNKFDLDELREIVDWIGLYEEEDMKYEFRQNQRNGKLEVIVDNYFKLVIKGRNYIESIEISKIKEARND